MNLVGNMKNNHKEVILHIKNAINACQNDMALYDAKISLQKILDAVSKTSNKRSKREEFAKKYHEEAKKKNDNWWKMIKENIKKNIESDLS